MATYIAKRIAFAFLTIVIAITIIYWWFGWYWWLFYWWLCNFGEQLIVEIDCNIYDLFCTLGLLGKAQRITDLSLICMTSNQIRHID